MNLDIIIQTMKVLTNLLIFIALFYSMQATRHLFIKKFKEEIMYIKKQVFMLFTVGLGFLTIAFSVDNIYQFSKIESMYLISNFFFSISYILFIAAFAYFWYKSKRLHKLPRKELVFFFTVTCAVFIWLSYLFIGLIMPKIYGLPIINKFFAFFNPIAVSIIFLLTLVVNPRLKAGIIRTPLWYISCGIFVYFIGYMFLTYAYWYPRYKWIPAIYSVLFLFSLLYFLLGSFAAKRKFSSIHRKIHQDIIKKLTRSL